MEDREDAGADGVPSRSDLKLIEQALRQDWPIPPRVKRDILQTLIDLVADPYELLGTDDDGEPRPDASARTKIAAARCIAQYCGLTLKQQALDLMRRKFEGKKGESLADLVAEAEALADAHERAREADTPPREVP